MKAEPAVGMEASAEKPPGLLRMVRQGSVARDPRSGLSLRQGTWYCRCGKRVFDLVVSLPGLMILSVPMTLIALIILIVEGRPVFFRQNRVGRRGELFSICKFRTMHNGADSTSSITVAGDDRTTPVGRWLRRSKLDELPQLWNVLRGEMSLVGPRPDVPGYLDRLSGEATAIWGLRPGITGPATLLFRREEELLASIKDYARLNDEVIYPEKVRLNLNYMHHCSLPLDLAYLLATVAPGLARLLGISRYLGIDYETFESRMSEAARSHKVSSL